ncbi:hypothetical protein JCM11251_005122 [Rhodosporidiobolus azoricus]
MSSSSSSPRPLTDAYLSPSTFLRSPRFHRTLEHNSRTISYAVAGAQPPQPSDVNGSDVPPPPPTVLWLNGMGSHRLACVLYDGLFAERGVRLITIDRPGAGLSTMCPLGERVKVSVEGTLAVLEAEGVKECSILSHSNGIIYTAALLLHLARLSASTSSHSPVSDSSAPSSTANPSSFPPAPPVKILSWILSSPYVPPWHSESLALSAARWVPSPLTASLGPLARFAQRVYEPFAKSAGWSAGVSGAIKEVSGAWGAGFVSPGTAADARAAAEGEEPPPPTQAEAERQRQRYREANAKRPEHRQLFGGEYYGPILFTRSMKIAMGEGKMEGMGQEALLCLRVGEGREWGWFTAEEEGGKVEETEMYEKVFGMLKETWGEEPLPMSVVYGAEDAIVPSKGQEYLRHLLVDRLKLVLPEQWQVVPDAGHDDALGLTCVAEPMLARLLAIHGGGVEGAA